MLPPTRGIDDTYSCSFTRFVANDAGETKVDIVSATLTDNEGNSVTESDSASVLTVNRPPDFSVEKSLIFPNPATVPAPGGTVWFRLVINNDGFEPVTITSLVDTVNGLSPGTNLDGRGSCAVPQTIPTGRHRTPARSISRWQATAGDKVSGHRHRHRDGQRRGVRARRRWSRTRSSSGSAKPPPALAIRRL